MLSVMSLLGFRTHKQARVDLSLRPFFPRAIFLPSEQPKEIPKGLGCASFGRNTSANPANGPFGRSLFLPSPVPPSFVSQSLRWILMKRGGGTTEGAERSD